MKIQDKTTLHDHQLQSAEADDSLTVTADGTQYLTLEQLVDRVQSFYNYLLHPANPNHNPKARLNLHINLLSLLIACRKLPDILPPEHPSRPTLLPWCEDEIFAGIQESYITHTLDYIADLMNDFTQEPETALFSVDPLLEFTLEGLEILKQENCLIAEELQPHYLFLLGFNLINFTYVHSLAASVLMSEWQNCSRLIKDILEAVRKGELQQKQIGELVEVCRHSIEALHTANRELISKISDLQWRHENNVWLLYQAINQHLSDTRASHNLIIELTSFMVGLCKKYAIAQPNIQATLIADEELQEQETQLKLSLQTEYDELYKKGINTTTKSCSIVLSFERTQLNALHYFLAYSLKLKKIATNEIKTANRKKPAETVEIDWEFAKVTFEKLSAIIIYANHLHDCNSVNKQLTAFQYNFKDLVKFLKDTKTTLINARLTKANRDNLVHRYNLCVNEAERMLSLYTNICFHNFNKQLNTGLITSPEQAQSLIIDITVTLCFGLSIDARFGFDIVARIQLLAECYSTLVTSLKDISAVPDVTLLNAASTLEYVLSAKLDIGEKALEQLTTFVLNTRHIYIEKQKVIYSEADGLFKAAKKFISEHNYITASLMLKSLQLSNKKLKDINEFISTQNELVKAISTNADEFSGSDFSKAIRVIHNLIYSQNSHEGNQKKPVSRKAAAAKKTVTEVVVTTKEESDKACHELLELEQLQKQKKMQAKQEKREKAKENREIKKNQSQLKQESVANPKSNSIPAGKTTTKNAEPISKPKQTAQPISVTQKQTIPSIPTHEIKSLDVPVAADKLPKLTLSKSTADVHTLSAPPKTSKKLTSSESKPEENKLAEAKNVIIVQAENSGKQQSIQEKPKLQPVNAITSSLDREEKPKPTSDVAQPHPKKITEKTPKHIPIPAFKAKYLKEDGWYCVGNLYLPSPIRRIMRKLMDTFNSSPFIYGGWVRDAIDNVPGEDVDIILIPKKAALPQFKRAHLLEMFAKQTGINVIECHGNQYGLFRFSLEHDGIYYDFDVSYKHDSSGTLTDHVSDLDLDVNTLCCDFYGNVIAKSSAISAFTNRQLTFVNNAIKAKNEVVILRMLRLFISRQAKADMMLKSGWIKNPTNLMFSIAAEDLIKQHAPDLLNCHPIRLSDEIRKHFCKPHFFAAMVTWQQYGVFAQVFPQFSALDITDVNFIKEISQYTQGKQHYQLSDLLVVMSAFAYLHAHPNNSDESNYQAFIDKMMQNPIIDVNTESMRTYFNSRVLHLIRQYNQAAKPKGNNGIGFFAEKGKTSLGRKLDPKAAEFIPQSLK